MRALHSLLCGAAVAAALAGCAKKTNSAGPAGAGIYAADCATCHQIDGKGSPGAFPPLAGNAVVTGDPARVIRIVKYGLSGTLRVDGTQYNGEMPAWGTQISPREIAAAITYIRSAWGNSAGAVTAEQVNAVVK